MDNVQEILKNTDLIVDSTEIHRVVEQVWKGHHSLELQMKGSSELYHVKILYLQKKKLADKKELWQIVTTDLVPTPNRLIARGEKALVCFDMDGYALETKLTFQKKVNTAKIKISACLDFPEVLRVRARRQRNRYPVPGDLQCQVTMMNGENRDIFCTGQLLDVSEEGLAVWVAQKPSSLDKGSAVFLQLDPISSADCPELRAFTLEGWISSYQKESKSEPGISSGERLHVRFSRIGDSVALQNLILELHKRVITRYGNVFLTAGSYLQTMDI
ncbi:MAG: PilZ domain-containing protein [Magnetococcus sp. DMHC-6]